MNKQEANAQVALARNRVGQEIKVNFTNTKRSVNCVVLDKTGITGIGENKNVRYSAYVLVKEVGTRKTHPIAITSLLTAYPEPPVQE